jgi:hypothetical protein
MRLAHRRSGINSTNSPTWREPPESSASQDRRITSSYIEDLLSDVPVATTPYRTSTASSIPPMLPAPINDPEENLIDLTESETEPRVLAQPQPVSMAEPSPHMDDLMQLQWSTPVQTMQPVQPIRASSSIAEQERRDSGRSHLHQSADLAPYYPDDKIFITPPPPEEKILVEPPEQREGMLENTYSASSRQFVSSRASISSAMSQESLTYPLTRPQSRELRPDSIEAVSPSSPDLASPLTPSESYFGYRRSSGTEALIPPQDNQAEEKLLGEMQQCLTSNNHTIQLDWAEEALRHCKMCSDFEARASKTQKPRNSVPNGEDMLQKMATQLVEGSARSGNGRALFIKARLMEKDSAIATEYLEGARRAGYHRSHYWIGMQNLAEKNKIALWHFETGVKYGDAACQYVSPLSSIPDPLMLTDRRHWAKYSSKGPWDGQNILKTKPKAVI